MPVRMLTALTVVAVLIPLAGNANAATVEPAGGIAAASSEVTFAWGAVSIICSFTLNGSFAAEFRAASEEVVGEIAEVEWGRCIGAEPTSMLDLPWELRFDSLTETGMDLTLEAFQFNFQVVIFGIPTACLYGGDVPLLLELDEEGDTGALRITANEIPLASGSSFCSATGELSGTFTLEPQQNIQL